MGYLFLLGLGLANFIFSNERLLDARRLGLEREGALVERQMFAREVSPTPASSPMGPNSSFWEAPWRPPPLLSYESSGTRSAQSRTSSLLQSGEAVEERNEGVWLHPPSKGELGPCREPALQPGPANRFPWSPWDRVVVVETNHVAWNPGISGIDFLSELERCLEPLGMSNENRVSLGISLDLLGLEEYEGARLSTLEARHGTPGIRNLSTGVGVTIRF